MDNKEIVKEEQLQEEKFDLTEEEIKEGVEFWINDTNVVV